MCPHVHDQKCTHVHERTHTDPVQGGSRLPGPTTEESWTTPSWPKISEQQKTMVPFVPRNTKTQLQRHTRSSHFYTISNGCPKGFFFLRFSLYASACTVPSFNILPFSVQKKFICFAFGCGFSVENWISCQTYCPTHRSINVKWCCQWHWYGVAEGALLPCCWAHEPRGAAEMAEMGKLWQKWKNVAGHSRHHRRSFSAWADIIGSAFSLDLS